MIEITKEQAKEIIDTFNEFIQHLSDHGDGTLWNEQFKVYDYLKTKINEKNN